MWFQDILRCLARASTSTQEIRAGDTASVPEWEWVDVKNPTLVKSGNNEFIYGNSCGIQRGGTVKVVGIEGNRLLVRYSVAGTQFGTSCPSGVVFFITKETFSKWRRNPVGPKVG